MPRKRASHRGLVLGAGGVLGSAWMIGALRAIETEQGIDVRDHDVVVGTSAGSVIAALLGLGVGADVMVNSERGIFEPGYPVLDYRDLGASLPPRPRMRMGSPRLLTATALHPRQASPMVALAALLPQGRGQIAAIGDLVSAAVARLDEPLDPLSAKRSASVPPGARRGRTPTALRPNGWPRSPGLRVVAMDFDTGGRVLFGSESAPPAPLPEAVMASCAIPGWYAPIRIAGRRFVDGGTRSPASLDLLADSDLDEVTVLAPACSFECDRPRGAVALVERQMRRAATRRLAREIELVQAAGIRVTVLCPGPEDLEVIGGNMMDLTRRAEVFETSLRTSTQALRALQQVPVRPARAAAAAGAAASAGATGPRRTGATSPRGTGAASSRGTGATGPRGAGATGPHAAGGTGRGAGATGPRRSEKSLDQPGRGARATTGGAAGGGVEDQNADLGLVG
ncbi:patatin [Frankia sp. CcI49]|uniref:patatin-like phospholipase family protein n=1 Tax=Frankia sp. CcI49 TaxID=1745382 RepID=UPI0009775667|nr:patatin-like phospholipase family protein [Frankia sp. CcI49]ONH53028.1 patatin [Frankia sp. CcI49]